MIVTSSLSLDYGTVYTRYWSFVGTKSPAENICKVLHKFFFAFMIFVLMGEVTIPHYKLLNILFYRYICIVFSVQCFNIVFL